MHWALREALFWTFSPPNDSRRHKVKRPASNFAPSLLPVKRATGRIFTFNLYFPPFSLDTLARENPHSPTMVLGHGYRRHSLASEYHAWNEGNSQYI